MPQTFAPPRCRRRETALALLFAVHAASADATAVERLPADPLRVAVYDLAPYGSLGPDGRFSGASVDLWRRVAEEMHWSYQFTLVSRMDAILAGLEQDRFDAAIGAITITGERLARVDFSYPAHRSGVAVAFARKTGLLSALSNYGAAASELGTLLAIMLLLPLSIGGLMWALERPGSRPERAGDSAVQTLHDGLYWAAVTMTTVGYGDKTPKTSIGRVLAVLWMIASLALVSLFSSTLVSRMTAENIVGAAQVDRAELGGLRLAAVTDSSGAEYLDSLGLAYTKSDDLRQALRELANGRVDAVVNSVGALQYAISREFSAWVAIPRGVLAPAYMAVALPANSPLKKPLDRALIRITASPEWRALEPTYFGQ
jgi:polar amino acid transport system substrate-binding protein